MLNNAPNYVLGRLYPSVSSLPAASLEEEVRLGAPGRVGEKVAFLSILVVTNGGE